MDSNRSLTRNGRQQNLPTRRDVLRAAGAFAGGAAMSQLFPATLAAVSPGNARQSGAAPASALSAARAEFGQVPIKTVTLTDKLTLLTGPGGNVVVLNGADGKLLVDTFTQDAWERTKKAVDGLGAAPVQFVVDTHWHWDHTDNNAHFHDAGAKLIAHENTRKRMMQPHDLEVLNLHIDASPADAWPEHTFRESYQMGFSGEHVALGYIAPAHTDSDIFVHFETSNVLHLGDVFFNGIYCYIDRGTGGSIGGMIAGASKMLAMIDNSTMIVPGHGPLGNKSDLRKFRDMLVTARSRVRKLKTSGKTLQESVAAGPFADLDPVWGKGLLSGDQFVQLVYTTL